MTRGVWSINTLAGEHNQFTGADYNQNSLISQTCAFKDLHIWNVGDESFTGLTCNTPEIFGAAWADEPAPIQTSPRPLCSVNHLCVVVSEMHDCDVSAINLHLTYYTVVDACQRLAP